MLCEIRFKDSVQTCILNLSRGNNVKTSKLYFWGKQKKQNQLFFRD